MNYIDLFCGIGGFRQILDKHGHKCVFSSDIKKDAIKAYKDNYNENCDFDITKVSEIDIPNHDIICGGFPCQPFSSINFRKTNANNISRKYLFLEIIRIAKYHKPKILFLENVASILSNDKGKTIKRIEEEIDKAGYDLYYTKLNASDFGLPQFRP